MVSSMYGVNDYSRRPLFFDLVIYTIHARAYVNNHGHLGKKNERELGGVRRGHLGDKNPKRKEEKRA